MKRRKQLALVLACCLLLSLFAACGGDSQPSSSSASSQQPSSSSASSKEEPSSLETEGDTQGETRVITILGTEGWGTHTDWTKVTDYGTYQQLQEWMKAKNIDIECEVVTAEQYSVVLQTRLASGQTLPDICKAHTMDSASLLAMAAQGTIVPVEDVFDKYSDGTAKKTIEETFPHVRPLITAADGHIYWFTNIQKKFLGDKVYDGNFGVLYRKDWTDKLNIATPASLEEFTQMLRQFREQDANGDGQANEILAIDVAGFRTGIAQWFGLPAGTVAVDPQTQKVVSAWKNPNVGAYFAYINTLVAEGIVDPSANSGEANAQNRLSGKWDYPNVTWNEAGCAELAPDANFVALMPLPAVEGVEPGAMGEPGSLVWEPFVVTKDCGDLQKVADLMDIVYSDDYATLSSYGREGFEWEYTDEGVIKGIEYTEDEAEEKNISSGASLWNGVLPRVQATDMRSQIAGCNEEKGKATLDLTQWPVQYPDGNQIDGIVALPTPEESERINTIKTNIDTASSELATKLAMGQIGVDQIEAEVKKLDDMGLEELIAIYQARYDRYLSAVK